MQRSCGRGITVDITSNANNEELCSDEDNHIKLHNPDAIKARLHKKCTQACVSNCFQGRARP